MAKKNRARLKGVGTPDIVEGCTRANMGNWRTKNARPIRSVRRRCDKK